MKKALLILFGTAAGFATAAIVHLISKAENERFRDALKRRLATLRNNGR